MPLFPGRSRKTVSANISELHTGPTYQHTAAKFGKERANAQAVAIAMDKAGMSRREDGGRTGLAYRGYAEGGAPELPPPDRPSYEELGRRIREMENYERPGFRPTAGIALSPQSADEAEDLRNSGEWIAGMGELALPFAATGPVGMAVGNTGRALAALALRYPAVSSALATTAALTAQPSDAGQKQTGQQTAKPGSPKPAIPAEPAEAGDQQLRDLLGSDQVLRRLQTQIDEQQSIANAPAQDYPKSARDGARTRAADLQKEFNARLQELTRANLPFDQAFPWYSQNRAWVNLALPAVAGITTRTAAGLADRAATAPWRASLRSADRALQRGDERAYEHYMARAGRWEPAAGENHLWGNAILPGIAGAGLGAELQLMPYQHNITNAPPGSKERVEAEAMMGSPWNYVPRGVYGAILGGIGGVGGGHAPNVSYGYRPPPVARTPAGAGRTIELEPMPEVGAGLGSRAIGARSPQTIEPSPPPEPAVTSGLGNATNRRPVVEDNAPMPQSATPPPTLDELLRRRYAPGPLEGGHYVDPTAGRTLGEAWVSPGSTRNVMIRRDPESGSFLDEHGEVYRRTINGKRRRIEDPARDLPAGWRRIALLDTPESAAASGGVIAQRGAGPNHESARPRTGLAYAGGGTVAGPVMGVSPGRADDKPVDVAGGSYVIPSDCVAALGDGNTLAGHKALEKVFGPSAPSRAGGGAVPIMISDGEHVLVPEQVTAFGKGDHAAGCRALDQFVKDTRNRNIKRLKSLPGPAKG